LMTALFTVLATYKNSLLAIEKRTYGVSKTN
jgi:hypothetical protein